MSAHIHEVLKEIIKYPGKLDTATFAQSIEEKFGNEASFSNCSGIDIPAAGILDFLIERSKIEIKEGKVYPKVSETCSH